MPMNSAPLADVRPVGADRDRQTPAGMPRRFVAAMARRLLGLLGLLWRWLVGAAGCLWYPTSIVVTGWTYRWVQGRVLRGWWKQSRLAREGSFADFCAGLGPAAPAPRPRWFWREPHRRAKGGSLLRKALRGLVAPVSSLWLNFTTGLKALFCTYLLTGWGCLLMYFGWRFGWHNSFNKGYELAYLGPLLSLLGITLFVLSLFYVLMAQVHQAVTGAAGSFFDFRFVARLVRARLTAYCGLVALLTLVALPLEVLKSALFIPTAFGNDPTLSDAEVFWWLLLYLFACCLLLFPTLLLVRGLTGRVYRSAVLKVLRQGTVTRAELHPLLANWLDRLALMPAPRPQPTGLAWAARAGSGLSYRVLLSGVLFVLGLLFVAQDYIGEFIQRHPGAGFINHVLVQCPAFDFIPGPLYAAAFKE
jgi:hypothetical protein